MKLYIQHIAISVVFLLTLTYTFKSYSVPQVARQAIVSSASNEASTAGVLISKKGGNAVDVAVATALALAVTRPYFAAFGGGGFAIVKIENKIEALDFREMAPKKTHESFYQEGKSSIDGGTAVGVPGIPMGLWDLHKKYGKLHWSELFEPAIQLAEKGFVVTEEWETLTLNNKIRFNSSGLKHFFKKNLSPLQVGETHKQPALAKFVREMRNRGPVPFYTGLAARDIVDSVQKAGGVITLEDLKFYKTRWLQPLQAQFLGHTLHLMPPPSSGGVVIKSAFRIFEFLELPKVEALSTDELHLIAESLSRAFRGRVLLGDPAFHDNPIERLTSEKYLKSLAKEISKRTSKKLKPLTDETLKDESSETTHLSVLMKNGDAVAMTITLNGDYGSGVVTEKFGIALNNEMDDFTTKPNEPNMFGLVQGKGNLVQPGKRPLSSMSPTLITKEDKTVAVLGAPGGPRIISSVTQVAYRLIANQWDVEKAVTAPRVHHQFLPHRLLVDKFGFSPETLKGLKDRGHELTNHSYLGKVYALKLRDDGRLEGFADLRGDGATEGH